MSAPARRLGVRKIERWVTADGREWPDAASAAEHMRLARLREWFKSNVAYLVYEDSVVERLATAFDREFAHTPRERP